MRMSGQAVVVAVAVWLVVSGCTADPGPTDPGTVEATTLATPTPSPSPSPTVAAPPERPEAMATPSADGAAAAASYFISLYPYVKGTGDLTEWDALSSPECDFCAGIRSSVEELHGRGHHNVGGVDIVAAAGTEVDAGRWYSARLHVLIAQSVDMDARGQVVADHPAEDREIDLVMTWADGWTIDEVGPAAVPTS